MVSAARRVLAGMLRAMDFLIGYVMGERAASRAAAFSRSAGASAGAQLTGDLHDVNERIDRLLLVVDAMWSMLRERGYTDEDLAARIRSIDAADGVVDGARKPLPRRCTKCDSMVEPGRRSCAFCGAELEAGSVLDGI
jgi:hypothetical protein